MRLRFASQPTQAHTQTMKLKPILLLFALALTCPTPRLNAESAPTKTVTIIGYDTMKYNVTRIEARPGQKIVIVLKSEGVAPKSAMAHNWILLKSGVDPMSYANAAISAKAEDYEPKSLANKVIASIPQLGPKETAKTTFTAPSTPGTYAYLCSFPAHCLAGMRGVLVVK